MKLRHAARTTRCSTPASGVRRRLDAAVTATPDRVGRERHGYVGVPGITGSLAKAQDGKEPGVLATEEALLAAYHWLLDDRLQQPMHSEEAYLAMTRRELAEACAPAPKRLSAMLECLDSMRIAAGDRPFGVVLLPANFQIEDRLWERATTGLDRSRLDRSEPQTSLAASLAARGIPYLDLLPAFRAVPPQDDGDRHCFLVRDSHYNVRGNSIAGRNLAPWLRSLLAGSGR